MASNTEKDERPSTSSEILFDSFCDELRIRTKDIHEESNKLVNMKLLVVMTDRRLWAQSIGEFYFIFRTLEECMDKHREHPLISSIQLDRAMYRTEAFERDLGIYYRSRHLLF